MHLSDGIIHWSPTDFINVKPPTDFSDFCDAFEEAVRQATPVTVVMNEDFGDMTIHVRAELMGEEFWHKVYTHNTLLDMPDDFIGMEASAAGRKKWFEYIDSLPWETYWEIG